MAPFSESDSGDADHDSAIRQFLIGIIPEPRIASPRNRDRHQPGTLIGFARNTQLARPQVETLGYQAHAVAVQQALYPGPSGSSTSIPWFLAKSKIKQLFTQ